MKFREIIGEPPQSYVQRRRITLAAQLLEQTDLRLAEIAERVGFKSEFSLSRASKAERGLSPAAFRSGASGKLLSSRRSRPKSKMEFYR